MECRFGILFYLVLTVVLFVACGDDTKNEEDAGVDATADADTDAETDMDADLEIDTEIDIDASLEMDADVGTNSNMDANFDPDTRADIDTNTNSETDTDSDAGEDTDNKTSEDSSAETDVDASKDASTEVNDGAVDAGPVECLDVAGGGTASCAETTMCESDCDNEEKCLFSCVASLCTAQKAIYCALHECVMSNCDAVCVNPMSLRCLTCLATHCVDEVADCSATVSCE